MLRTGHALGLLLAMIMAGFGCAPKGGEAVQDVVLTQPEYAQGFKVLSRQGLRVLQVGQPSQQSEKPAEYVLLEKGDLRPDECLDGCIEVPVKRIAAVSTTHAALFAALDARDRLVGLAGARYLHDSGYQARLNDGRLVEIGNESRLDHEQLIALEPDIVMTYTTGGGPYETIKKISELGLQPVLNAEYLEAHPLGQAEWVRFAGILLGVEAQAATYFEEVRDNYLRLKDEAATHKPDVFCGMAFQGDWTIPGGRSHVATLIRDAGGRYLWEDDSARGILHIDFESAYHKAQAAEYWLNTGSATSLDDIRAVDPRYAWFQAIEQGRVFNNNARINAGGGNDYWGQGVVRPDLILQDLKRIFAGKVDSLFFYNHLR